LNCHTDCAHRIIDPWEGTGTNRSNRTVEKGGYVLPGESTISWWEGGLAIVIAVVITTGVIIASTH
tara:strand:+ start:1138 stop:1335 length:198 start_codon:yes stop_codon:yes gene_type:complete